MSSGGAGLGNTRKGCTESPDGKVAVQLELGDLALIRAPFGVSVAQEPFEDVFTQGVAYQLAFFHLRQRPVEGIWQRGDAE